MTDATPRLVPRPIDREAFAPFGQLLDSPGDTPRLDFAGIIENGRPAARPNLALIRAQPIPERLVIEQMERHPYSNQGFFPLDVDQYLVIVCKDDGAGNPDPHSLVAFRVNGNQAINYNVGTWHYGMTTIGKPGIFAMIVFEDKSQDDCHFRSIPAVEISL